MFGTIHVKNISRNVCFLGNLNANEVNNVGKKGSKNVYYHETPLFEKKTNAKYFEFFDEIFSYDFIDPSRVFDTEDTNARHGT